MKVDTDRVSTLLAEIAEELILPKFGHLKENEVKVKSGPNDLVTEVDEAVECALRQRLSDLAPGAGFIGEELAAADPSSVEALRGEGAFWIVDPLDGTRNFVRGIEEFGTIVAFVVDGQTRGGWIHALPAGRTLAAESGAGAFWDAEKLTRAASSRDRLIGLRSLGWLAPERQNRMRERMSDAFDSRPSHCSALAYINLALGRADFKISSLIHPWDHAAGVLALEEAGGRAAYLDSGAAYFPAPSVNQPMLACAGADRWAVVADVLSN